MSLTAGPLGPHWAKVSSVPPKSYISNIWHFLNLFDHGTIFFQSSILKSSYSNEQTLRKAVFALVLFKVILLYWLVTICSGPRGRTPATQTTWENIIGTMKYLKQPAEGSKSVASLFYPTLSRSQDRKSFWKSPFLPACLLLCNDYSPVSGT